jgi:molecular chaperone DnaK
MTITGQSSLSKADIDRMVRDAEAHAEEDRRRREEAEVRNTADTLVYQTKKLMKDHEETLTQEDRSRIEPALSELETALTGSDIEAIRRATEALGSASQAFGQRLYEQAAANQATTTPGGPGPADDEVVEAEIVDDQGNQA